MKYYNYNLHFNKIEYYKTYFGKETVFVNGTKVSECCTLFGAAHFFKVDFCEILLKTDYNLFKSNKAELQLFRNRRLIDVNPFKFHKRFQISLLGMLFLVGFGIIKMLFVL